METVLLDKAEKYIGVTVVDVPEVIHEVHLLDSFSAEVDVLQQLYLLASYNAEVAPLLLEVILLDKYEQYISTEPTGIYLLAKHDTEIVPEGIPEEIPEAPPARVNWWLWGGLAALVVIAVIVVAGRQA